VRCRGEAEGQSTPGGGGLCKRRSGMPDREVARMRERARWGARNEDGREFERLLDSANLLVLLARLASQRRVGSTEVELYARQVAMTPGRLLSGKLMSIPHSVGPGGGCRGGMDLSMYGEGVRELRALPPSPGCWCQSKTVPGGSLMTPDFV
jgi:hypothetical protein